MTRRAPLPPALADRPFSVQQARDAGLAASRLRAHDLEIPFRGVREARSAGALTLLDACRRYAPRMKPWQFFSHETALGLRGVPTPRFPYRVGIHVSSHRPAREPRIGGIVGHRLQTRDDAATVVDGVRVEDVVRAWRQAAGSWGIDDLIAAADFLVGRGVLATLDELYAEIRTMRGRRMPELERALSQVRAGAASSEETRLRLILQRAGLPEPEPNWPFRDPAGRLVAVLDLGYPRYKVDVEYDGGQHALDPHQYRRDVERRAALARWGWQGAQILKHHLRGDGRAAVAVVREVLIRAGWRG